MRHGGEEPLRALTDAEREQIAAIVRARSERGDLRQRAVALAAVAEGRSFDAAARRAGYTKGYTVTRLVRRFNTRGLAALEIAPGRGRKATYQAVDRQQILDVLQQPPEREADQSATWSLTLLQRRLRGDGLPQVSRDTIHRTLRQAGYTYQRTRTWCLTGTARRRRKAGTVTVVDPEAEQKKGGSSRRTAGRRRRE
jgi:transposase